MESVKKAALQTIHRIQNKYKPSQDEWQMMFGMEILWNMLDGINYKLTPKVYDAQYRIEDMEIKLEQMQSEINRLKGNER